MTCNIFPGRSELRGLGLEESGERKEGEQKGNLKSVHQHTKRGRWLHHKITFSSFGNLCANKKKSLFPSRLGLPLLPEPYEEKTRHRILFRVAKQKSHTDWKTGKRHRLASKEAHFADLFCSVLFACPCSLLSINPFPSEREMERQREGWEIYSAVPGKKIRNVEGKKFREPKADCV